MPIAVRTIRTPEELESIRPAWQDLWQNAAGASVFQSPDWLIPWWRHFAPGELACVGVWQDETLVGLAPLYIAQRSRRALPVGISLSDYLDILVASESAEQIVESMHDEISRSLDADEICFPDVLPAANVLKLGRAIDFVSQCESGEACPDLMLGTGHEALCNVPARQRRKLRMAQHRAERRGCVLAAVAADEMRAFVPRLMNLHAARQQQFGRAGLGGDARVLPFFADAFELLAQAGYVSAYVIACGDQLVAGYLGFLHNGVASAYFGGFDPAFAFESPGTILLGHAMQDAAARGARAFDFLRGAEPYKFAWGARERHLVAVTLSRHARVDRAS